MWGQRSRERPGTLVFTAKVGGKKLGGDVPCWAQSKNTHFIVCGWEVCDMTLTCP